MCFYFPLQMSMTCFRNSIHRLRLFFRVTDYDFLKASIKTTSIVQCDSTQPKQPKNLKGRSVNAQQWLIRQFKDPYVLKAKIANYRCRSAFKLIEIDDRYKVLKPGSRVVDCGAAPGGWTQVAVERINARGEKKYEPMGRIVAVDKLALTPIPGAHVLSARDFTKPETHQEIHDYFASSASNGDSTVDVVMSDMAPSATGHSECDHERIIELSYLALVFAARNLSKGGHFLTKIWNGKNETKLKLDMEKLFEHVHFVKPSASRDNSAEVFLLGRHFKCLKSDKK